MTVNVVLCLTFCLEPCAMARVQGSLLERQEKSPGARVHQELRVFIYEEFEEDNDHEAYEQRFPVEVPFGAQGPAGRISGIVALMSGCAWRKKDPTLPMSLAVPLLPQDEPPGDRPLRNSEGDLPPPWELPPLRVPPPLMPALPTADRNRPLTVTLRVNSLMTHIRLGAGSGFGVNPLNTQGSQIVNPPSGGGVVPQPGDPQVPPPPPPPGTKLQEPAAKGILGGGGSGASDSSDTPLLVGPELALPLKADVTEWAALEWLPEFTSLSLYGHALFGEMKIFDHSVDVSLYGLGPRVGWPIVRESWIQIDGLISAGPAFLHTDIGDTAGLDFATGVGARLNVAGTLSLMSSVEFRAYVAPDVDARGPSFNVGFDLGW